MWGKNSPFPGCCPRYGRNTALRFRFQARPIRVHSWVTCSQPRKRNGRKPIADLMMPNTGATVDLRKASRAFPTRVCRAWAMVSSGVASPARGAGSLNRSRPCG